MRTISVIAVLALAAIASSCAGAPVPPRLSIDFTEWSIPVMLNPPEEPLAGKPIEFAAREAVWPATMDAPIPEHAKALLAQRPAALYAISLRWTNDIAIRPPLGEKSAWAALLYLGLDYVR